MLNRTLSFQTLVGIVAAALPALSLPALADPPSAWPGQVQAFRDWRLDCRADPCALDTVVRAGDGSEVLRVAVTGGAAPALVLATSLPLYLPDGTALAIGSDPERPVAWRTCGTGGCEATLPLDPAALASLRRERGGTAAFTLVDGVRVRLPFSLLGFSAGLAAAEAR